MIDSLIKIMPVIGYGCMGGGIVLIILGICLRRARKHSYVNDAVFMFHSGHQVRSVGNKESPEWYMEPLVAFGALIFMIGVMIIAAPHMSIFHG